MSKRRGQKATPPESANDSLRTQLAKWSGLWNEFVDKHADWITNLAIDEAAYTLPPPVIEELASPRGAHRRLRSLLAQSDVGAERDFAEVCSKFRPYTIGVWQDCPLQFPLLDGSWCAAAFEQARSKVEEATETGEQLAQLQQFERSRQQTRHQQLAYAGQLCFHLPFREELTRLREQWRALPDAKPAFGPWQVPRVMETTAPTTSLEYYRAYDRFRARWHLACLVSWDVPWPMGRVEGVPIAVLASLYNGYGTADYYPPHLESPRQTVREKTQILTTLADQLPEQVTPPPAGRRAGRADRTSELESAYRMWLVEMTIRRRYGSRKGMTSSLIRAFAGWLQVSEDHIRKRLRRIYADYLSP